jgi:hypothetical protein
MSSSRNGLGAGAYGPTPSHKLPQPDKSERGDGAWDSQQSKDLGGARTPLQKEASSDRTDRASNPRNPDRPANTRRPQRIRIGGCDDSHYAGARAANRETKHEGDDRQGSEVNGEQTSDSRRDRAEQN